MKKRLTFSSTNSCKGLDLLGFYIQFFQNIVLTVNVVNKVFVCVDYKWMDNCFCVFQLWGTFHNSIDWWNFDHLKSVFMAYYKTFTIKQRPLYKRKNNLLFWLLFQNLRIQYCIYIFFAFHPNHLLCTTTWDGNAV